MIKLSLLFLLSLVCITFSQDNAETILLETFSESSIPNKNKWVVSKHPDYTGQWEVKEPEQPLGIEGEKGLVVVDVAKKHAIAVPFSKPLDNTDKDLVIQYEVKLQHGLDCGGAYIKLLDEIPDFSYFSSESPYVIMFGPDKCGAQNKVHFIIRHTNPISGKISEHSLSPHLQFRADKKTHLYTLIIRKDNTFTIMIDREVVSGGSLLQNFAPPINPSTEIDDPTDIKPADWVDEEKIPDPNDKKPAEWDEEAPKMILDPTAVKPANWLDDAPESILDPNAEKPEDWNDEEDGEWVAPLIRNPLCDEHGCGVWTPPTIKNPNYKGKWSPALIPNPLYKGQWFPRKVPNPHYFVDEHPHNLPKIYGLGIELWTMNNGILFDNILITHDVQVAEDFAEKTFVPKQQKEAENDPQHPPRDVAGLISAYYNDLHAIVIEYPYIVAALGVGAVLPLIFCCFWTPSVPHPVETEKNSDEENEE
eukprot:TRINITY_DN3489_c0_g3_i2.p1 TRINITY_DN3489_c0_g3~~TRINITY_DN3489_c0_g3_i2.p1  ORF type:complete len:477 (-),score=92.24 TRINITY_DN3489_c0_g3_i2:59-1489(-)